MAHCDDRVMPAIVLGAGHTALGVLRSLVLAGIPAYVACPAGDLATHSRWYRPPPGDETWDGGVRDRDHDALQRLSLPGAVLIPGADDVALWLADLPQDDPDSRFRVSSSSRRTLEILQDKTRFGDFLASTGIAHPRTFAIGSRDDIDAIPFEELDRVFLKPADSQTFSQQLGIKGVWASNRAQFVHEWDRLDARGFKVIAQEYVPGPSSEHYFIDGFRDRHGVLAGLFARRRLRMFPADFGNSSFCQSIALSDVDGALCGLTTLLDALHYRGIFSAEFKRDTRTGEFKLLEVNTRAWWYVEFAARCGVNVCAMAVEDANERALPAATGHYPPGVGCASLAGDIQSFFSQPAATRESLAKTLRTWTQAHFHVFRADDPGPAWAVFKHSLAGVVRKAARRIRARRNHPVAPA